ncbi:MAG: hypothetical protein RIR70_2265 [Pseudomonadota bacterium]|jgi:hypothetical protein
MKADGLQILIAVAKRRERLSAINVANRKRAVEEAVQLRAKAQLRMEQASFKAETERMKQAKVGREAAVTAQRLRDGHEYGYFLLWKALSEFSEVRKADVALAERRSDLAQATLLHRQMMRRRQKLEAMQEKLMQKEFFAVGLLEGEG